MNVYSKAEMKLLSAEILEYMPNLDRQSYVLETFSATKEQEGTVFADAVQAAVGMLSADSFAAQLRNSKTAAAPYVSRYLFAAVKAIKDRTELDELLSSFADAVEAAAELRGVPLKDKWRTSSTLAGYLSYARTVFCALAGTVTVDLFDESSVSMRAMPELIYETSLQKAATMVKKAKGAAKAEAEARLAQSVAQDALHTAAAAVQAVVQAPPRLESDGAAANEPARVVKYARPVKCLVEDVRYALETAIAAGADMDLLELMFYELREKQSQQAGAEESQDSEDLPDATPQNAGAVVNG